jgi:hypothetical protein
MGRADNSHVQIQTIRNLPGIHATNYIPVIISGARFISGLQVL